MARKRKSRIKLAQWNCPYCGRNAILGNIYVCPGCGSPRGDNTKFEATAKPIYLSDEEAQKVDRDPDWVCQHCDRYNHDEEKVCVYCGNPREAEDPTYFEHLKENSRKSDSENVFQQDTDFLESKDSDSFYNTTSHSDYDEVESDEFSSANLDSNRTEEGAEKIADVISSGLDVLKSSAPRLAIGAGILAVIVLVVLGLVKLFTPTTETMVVEQLRWEYSMEIQEYRTVNESGWNLPSGARLRYSQEEVYDQKPVVDHYVTKSRDVQKQVFVGYEDVKVGERDLGNGYIEEIWEQQEVYEYVWETELYSEPVYRYEDIYRTKYYYEVDKWLYDRTERTTGYTQETYWPTFDLTEKERVSSQDEDYFVVVIDEFGKRHEILVSHDEWLTIEADTKVVVKKWLWTEEIVFE